MKFRFIKKFVILFLILTSVLVLFSCSSDDEIINYNIEIVETKAKETKAFSFERDNVIDNEKKIITKKDRDFMASENIKDLIKNRTRKPKEVRGVYLPAYVVGKAERFDPIFENIKNSSINTIVVDVKDEIGRITFNMDAEVVKEFKTIEPQIKDIKSFIDLCHENDIYVIARVATFLDNFATKKFSSLAIKTKKGKNYKDNTGYYWLNPYNEKVQDYILDIGKGCAKAGFDEVQYDYFRFSADSGMRNVVFNEEETKGKSKIEIITEIAQRITQELIPLNIYVSIDVFGAIMNSYRDQNSIGQEYQTLLKYVDYLCPMLYPSHYANTTFGLKVPDKEPYETILSAIKTSDTVIEKTFDSASHYGKIRPWLQAFTANYLPDYITYDVKEYKEQIKAVEDAGLKEWLFWHPSGNYKWEAFIDN